MKTLIPFTRVPILAAGGFLLLWVAACDKKSSPAGTAADANADRIPPAQPMDRLAWNLKTLVNPYETAGFANRSWDKPAKRALVGFASLRCRLPETNGSWTQIIATNCEAAVAAGCKDPMIGYLHIRFPADDSQDDKAVADALCKVAVDIQATSYPSVRKFYAVRRALEKFFSAYGSRADRTPLQQVGNTSGHAEQALRDPTIPIEEAYEICSETLESYDGVRNLSLFQRMYRGLEKPMLAKWPNDYRPWLIQGQAYIKIAWIHRGGGYANTVSEEGWKDFHESLTKAKMALEHSWELDQKNTDVPLKMMTVELGQGRDRKSLELWFDRAMAINTNCYQACNDKLYYLEPKWHGSAPIMLAFGRECVESKQWGGRVPLILLDAHEAVVKYLEGEDKTNYWKQPEVWLDIQAAYDRFFELNPDAVGWYHNYARSAWRCERWDKVKELIPKLGKVNYAYFGGKDRYDEMVRLADANAGKTPPDRVTLEIELSRLSARIANQIDLGKETETELADEIKMLDALPAKFPDATSEEKAGVLMNKAMLFLRVFEEPDKARELFTKIKQDFAGTDAARAAGQILAGISKEEESKKIQASLVPGRPFPDFETKDLAGKPLSVANCKGKVLLIDFWATWCPPCVEELPNVLAVYAKYHDQGLEIIGISLDQERDTLEAFIRKKQIAWPQCLDGESRESSLATKYGVDSIPTTFLLDREGKILAKDLRGDELGDAVAKALAKQP